MTEREEAKKQGRLKRRSAEISAKDKRKALAEQLVNQLITP